MPLQHLGRLVGIHAVRPAAVRDYLAIAWQLRQATLELVDGHGPRTGDMPLAILERRAHVQQGHATFGQQRP